MKNSEYLMHLVECQCILQIFKNKTKPVYHKIPVFSLVNDDKFQDSHVVCDNCGIVHHVNEVSKSEIKWGFENLESLVKTKEDVKFNLESQGFDRLIHVLEKEDLPVAKWEKVEYSLENKLEENIVLQKTDHDNNIVLKVLEIKDGKFKIKKEILQRYL